MNYLPRMASNFDPPDLSTPTPQVARITGRSHPRPGRNFVNIDVYAPTLEMLFI
jgi:hypothetical protein